MEWLDRTLAVAGLILSAFGVYQNRKPRYRGKHRRQRRKGTGPFGPGWFPLHHHLPPHTNGDAMPQGVLAVSAGTALGVAAAALMAANGRPVEAAVVGALNLAIGGAWALSHRRTR